MNSAQVAELEKIQSVICAHSRILSRGNGTKPALSGNLPDAALVVLSKLSGILEYEPAEFTFTALSGTRVDEVNRVLRNHGQYLPFEPPLTGRGATLGGTVASGLSGPGRYQFGGVRDFLLGVRYIDSEGQLIRGGGRVVKNAAGYDLPKLMVGSLGQFGVLAELTFKVLPQPETSRTVLIPCANLENAIEIISRLAMSPLDPNAIDIEMFPPDMPPEKQSPTGWRLIVRLTGLESAMSPRLERLKALTVQPEGELQIIHSAEETHYWDHVCDMEWVPSGWGLIKIPLTPRLVPKLETALANNMNIRRYSAGGQVLWMATPEPIPTIHEKLSAYGFSGLVVLGQPGLTRLGVKVGESFERLVKKALDPINRFVGG